jgi:magnesium-transporting ATPase (P-type)
MLKVLDGEAFPSDLVFLKSSSTNGVAYVDTMNLDGETNLKERI